MMRQGAGGGKGLVANFLLSQRRVKLTIFSRQRGDMSVPICGVG
jgi:hypothetical protein